MKEFLGCWQPNAHFLRHPGKPGIEAEKKVKPISKRHRVTRAVIRQAFPLHIRFTASVKDARNQDRNVHNF
jgi:hypothetical protein